MSHHAPHGAPGVLVLQVVLAVALALAGGGTVSTSGLGVASFLAALLQLGMVVVYQPYLHQSWNRFHAGLSAMFLWAACCTLLALWRGHAQPVVRALPHTYAGPGDQRVWAVDTPPTPPLPRAP
jgi:hypothetical protein